VPVQYEGVKEDAPPRGLLHGLGKVACYIPGPLVELGLCSTIRKGWRFSSRMVHSSDGGEGPPHYQLDRAAIQPAEDARADAGDKKDPELLQVGVAVEGPGQHLLRGDEDASMVSGSRETAGKSWISIGRMGGLRGY